MKLDSHFIIYQNNFQINLKIERARKKWMDTAELRKETSKHRSNGKKPLKN